MPTIALATYASFPSLPPHEQLLVEPLAARGIRGVPAVWDDASVAWSEFDGVVIRSCWDYHLRPSEFFAWIDRLTAAGVPIWNSPATLRWNSRKTYLHDLAIGGVRTVPTLWLVGDGARRSTLSTEAILDDTGWDVAVVKPIVSASAHETWKLTRAEARTNRTENDARLHAIVARCGAMVQPFVPEVESDGEWSLLFFDEVFSHAVIKRAAAGDFRVGRLYGGTHDPATPTPATIAQARRALRSAPGGSVYARVDGVMLGDGFAVTELEVLDPSMYLDTDPAAPDRFASAIQVALEKSGKGEGGRKLGAGS